MKQKKYLIFNLAFAVIYTLNQLNGHLCPLAKFSKLHWRLRCLCTACIYNLLLKANINYTITVTEKTFAKAWS